VLEVLLNTILHEAIMLLIVMSIMVSSVSLAACIKLQWIAVNFLPLLTSVFLFIPTFGMLLVMLSGMVGAHLKSIRVLQGLRQSLSRNGYNNRTKKWVRMLCKSCSPVKLRFGSGNILEACTPLNCSNFALNLSIQILLVGL